MLAEMRIGRRVLCGVLAASAALLAPLEGWATNCTAQAELGTLDRDALTAASGRVATAVLAQDLSNLQAILLPQEASEWNNIRATVELAVPLVKGGHFQLRDVYLLDATDQSATADTQFFCSNATGSLTITINMTALPPGRYAVALADAAGAPLAGQMGVVLAWDGAATAWKLAGLTVRPGMFDGHAGVWHWSRARELARTDPWSGWLAYDAARYLLLPDDFLSSPNLRQLNQEQSLIAPSPDSQFPLSLPDGDRTWKIDAVGLDASLHEPDLGVAYESTGVTDPAALRTEATAVMTALLQAHPDLRANLH